MCTERQMPKQPSGNIFLMWSSVLLVVACWMTLWRIAAIHLFKFHSLERIIQMLRRPQKQCQFHSTNFFRSWVETNISSRRVYKRISHLRSFIQEAVCGWCWCDAAGWQQYRWMMCVLFDSLGNSATRCASHTNSHFQRRVTRMLGTRHSSSVLSVEICKNQ